MKLIRNLLLLMMLPVGVLAQNSKIQKDSLPNNGIEKKSSSFFRDRYQYNDLVHYLDNLNDFVTYESETTGQFNMPDPLIFSIAGNSYRWNKYYLDGFRLDSRFNSGSNNYMPDMYNHSLSLDYYKSVMNYTTDKVTPNSAAIRFNVGGLGGISPYTEDMVRWFHKTASDRLYTLYDGKYPLPDYRAKMRGAGSLFLNYGVESNGRKYAQQLYADFGTRMLVDFDQNGISDYYPESFSKVQLNGEIPVVLASLFDKTNYIANFQQRDHMNNEYYFGKSETAKNDEYNISLYGSRTTEDMNYTSGLTFGTNVVRHNNLNFSRNLVDQDGEGFEPWYPDGSTTELSHAFNFTKHLTSALDLNIDTYNSLMHFSPSASVFHNQLYAQGTDSAASNLTAYKSLYVYDWTTHAFTSGLLENTVGLKTQKVLSKGVTMRASVDLTLDGMLIADGKSMIRPNWQGQLAFDIRPVEWDWFAMELNISRNRVSFNYDDVKYLSSDYLNANVYYWNDTNGDKKFQDSEKGAYFNQTGGKYHTAAKGLKQTSYWVVDLPLYFKIDEHHEISLLNTYKKYYDCWTTRFDTNNADDYMNHAAVDGKEIYYFKDNAQPNYVLDHYPKTSAYMEHPETSFNFLTNTPFYFSSTWKYQYTSENFLFSFSWCSYVQCGISTLGNGPLHNNMNVYSETTANPNIEYKLIGRLNQERAYIARILGSYKFNQHFSMSVVGKFKDGQAFTSYSTQFFGDDKRTQVAMWADHTKGINPYNLEFGSRKDAFFNIDLSATYKGKLMNHNYEVQAMVYNLYDFGTELLEYTFEPNPRHEGRVAMSMNIPRGLMLTGKFYF